MSSRDPKQAKAPGPSRRAILLWVTVFGLVIGFIRLGQPIEDLLRNLRNALSPQNASGEIVVVTIDDRSIERIGDWPWPRSRQAQIVDTLDRFGARKIAFSFDFSTKSTPADDAAFRQALARSRGRVILPARLAYDPVSDRRSDVLPLPAFRADAELANMNVRYNYRSEVWRLPYALETGGATLPSLAVRLSDRADKLDGEFPIDYSITLASVPTLAAADLLEGKIGPEDVSGKTVVIGMASTQFGDRFSIPGSGRAPAVFLHVLGAETLLKGRPLNLGWLPPFVATVFLVAVFFLCRNRALARSAAVVAVLLLGPAPFLAERHLVFFDIIPSSVVLLSGVLMRAWWDFRRSYRARGLINAISGLPNLNALREESGTKIEPLVAARIHNFAEITSALPHESERALVEQIAARLAIGAGGSAIYQGDEGIFVWFARESAVDLLGDQLEALHALCRTPVVVLGTSVDLVVTFGVEAGTDRSVSSRIGSALVAADEAKAEGLRWKQFDAAKLKDAAWKLSLLGRLDAAIDTGEIWVAYQPKLDIASKRVVGAEALARWSHPEKGEIGPMEFIPAAEQHNRIEKLTVHVLSEAIRSAAAVNRRGIDFEVAVNLSARLLDALDLVERVDALLARYELPASRLTLEVTESAAMTGSERSLEVLGRLRALGVRISIDDYGTGFSTLEALKKIPATELKIDKGFVRMIDRSQSDRLMVNSTIQLAHSLGRTVVAEGVETTDILYALEAMGCDTAQGYLIGRPMKFDDFAKLMLPGETRTAA